VPFDQHLAMLSQNTTHGVWGNLGKTARCLSPMPDRCTHSRCLDISPKLICMIFSVGWMASAFS
jgi:hypothetical protein